MHDDDHCVFCDGRRAYENGEPPDANPHPEPPPELRGTDAYHEHPHVLWDLGYKTGPMIERMMAEFS